MGRRLAKRGVHPDLMLSSPAVRALKTARLLARRLHYRRRDIVVRAGLYACQTSDLMRAVRALDSRYQRVMLVGHNPEITALARRLGGQMLNMPTCAVACFDFDVESWADIARESLVHMRFDTPERT